MNNHSWQRRPNQTIHLPCQMHWTEGSGGRLIFMGHGNAQLMMSFQHPEFVRVAVPQQIQQKLLDTLQKRGVQTRGLTIRSREPNFAFDGATVHDTMVLEAFGKTIDGPTYKFFWTGGRLEIVNSLRPPHFVAEQQYDVPLSQNIRNRVLHKLGDMGARTDQGIIIKGRNPNLRIDGPTPPGTVVLDVFSAPVLIGM
jgi:hypothetical protein